MLNPRNWRRIGPAVGLGLVGALLALTAAVPEAVRGGDEPKQQEPARLPMSVVDTHHLVELFNQELYQLLRQEMERGPSGDEWWERARSRIAGRRSGQPGGDPGARRQRSPLDTVLRSVAAAGKSLAEAAETLNLERTREAWRGLVQRCNACHSTMAPEHAPELKP